MAHLEEHLHHLNGITLHTVEAGNKNGLHLIFLHGFPEFWYGWKNQLNFFMERGYRVIAPDQRGYNTSSKPVGVKLYSLHLLCEDIVALIKILTDKKVVIVGHDWGGAVAWQLALHYPQLIRHLVIINMPHPAVFNQTLQTNPNQLFRSLYAGFFQLPFLPESLSSAFGFALLTRTLIKTSNRGTFSKEDINKYKKAWSQPNAISSMINWYRAYKYNTLSNHGLIQLRSLMIWGKKDKFLIYQMAEASIKKCTNGNLEMINEGTHWVHHEYPDLVNTLILNFLLSQE